MVQQNLNFEGDNLRDQGIEKALVNNDLWKDRVLEEIVYLSHKQETFTSDDLRISCSHLVPRSGKAWGAVFSIASKLHLIKKTGRYVKSCISSNHSRPVAEWELA